MLPRVKLETRESLIASIRSEPLDGNYHIVNCMERIEKENPEVYLFILEQFYREATSPATVVACCIALYELLRRQDEADQMNREFGL